MSRLSSRWGQIWSAMVIIVVVIGATLTGWNRFGPGSTPPVKPAVVGPVVTVNGVALTPEMIERELKVSRLNVVTPLSALQGEDLERAREEALNQLISRQLILQAASRQGFRLEDALIEDRTRLLFGGRSDETLVRALEQAGATYEDMLWWVGQIITVEAYTTEVIMAGAAPEARQQVYNEWLNARRAEAQITYPADQSRVSQALVGQPAPNFTLTSLEGQPVSLADYSGQVVLVNFWATWCPSCLSEMPDYEQVYRQKAPEFVVLGVNLQENGASVRHYAAGLGLTFPVLLDDSGTVTTRHYQVTGMPGSFIIDRDGVIFYRHLGPMSADTLTAKLAELGL